LEAKEFGEYLKGLRLKKKLTIRQLDTYSGVSNSYISQMERGQRGVPKPDILQKLSKPLGVPYEDLMENAGYLNKGELLRSSIGAGIIKFDFPEGIDENNVGYLALKELDDNRELAYQLSEEQIDILTKHLFPTFDPDTIDFLLNMQKDKEKAMESLKALKTIESLSEEDKKEVLNYIKFKEGQSKDQ
jgi:transcriptional regulator with XRE-family HTH domain